MFSFFDKYKYGIFAVLGSYLGLYIYFNVQTYDVPVFYEIWDKQSQLEDPEIAIKSENIEMPDASQAPPKDIKSFASDANDQREKSNENWDKNKLAKDVEAQVKQMEQDAYKASGGANKQAEIKQLAEEKRKELEKNKNNSKGQTNPVSGGDKAFAGSTMVTFSVKNHGAFQNNEWYVRNPGYTCGKSANGSVRVRIRVDRSGKVLQATYEAAYSANADECMIQTALKYARM